MKTRNSRKEELPCPLFCEFRVFISAFSAFCFAVISALIFWDRARAVDASVGLWIQTQSSPALDAWMRAMTHGGDRLTLILVCSALTVFFIIRRNQGSTLVFDLTAVWLAIGAGYATNYTLKVLFARSRPELSPLLLTPSGYSYPSGHAMVSTIVYGCAACLLARIWPRAAGRIIGAAVIWIFLIGLSRVYLDAHWPSDVLAGFAGGWIVVSLIIGWYDRSRYGSDGFRRGESG
jgi:membrane-associated phospholipid phosphatase